jgi:diguanylate cyclase (GGDEF)-like protein
MKPTETENLSVKNLQIFRNNFPGFSILSLAALFSTFFVASSDIVFLTKLLIFVSIVVLFLAATLILNFRRDRNITSESLEKVKKEEEVFNPEVENRLFALEEANKFFGTSLKSSDMFRLITSRVNEIIPFASSVLFLAENKNTQLRIALSVGKNARGMMNIQIPFAKGLAGKTFVSGKSQIEIPLASDIKAFPKGILKGLNSAISVPLYRDAEIYGVFELFGDETVKFDKNSLMLLEAVGERVAPLFLSSFAFEENISNAMTDALTSLPNERAFYLVLENQIAQSQRYRGERSLTILSIDIKSFAELNQQYGHIAGNNILTFSAALIRKQLRQMDFLARSHNDEFLVVLPTATDEIIEDIIQRIEKAFASVSFEIPEQEKNKLKLRLNFGSATFLQNGETANQLLKNARLKKQELKLVGDGKILKFPKGFVK